MRPRIVAANFDSRDARALAEFWAQVLTWDVATWSDDRGALIVDRSNPGFSIGFARVPERKAAKNRFHPDLETHRLEDEIARLEAMGATTFAEHRPGSRAWNVLQDPEGNEFCLSDAVDEGPPAGSDLPGEPKATWIGGFGVDCMDPKGLATFWSEMLGFEATDELDEGVLLRGTDDAHFWIWFQRVLEPKAAKNRFHLDLEVDDYRLHTEWAVALGATVVAEHGQALWDWNVMQDPEGNEFCLGRIRPPLGG